MNTSMNALPLVDALDKKSPSESAIMTLVKSAETDVVGTKETKIAAKPKIGTYFSAPATDTSTTRSGHFIQLKEPSAALSPKPVASETTSVTAAALPPTVNTRFLFIMVLVFLSANFGLVTLLHKREGTTHTTPVVSATTVPTNKSVGAPVAKQGDSEEGLRELFSVISKPE